MKNITTREESGPPLPHDEWIAEQKRLAIEEAKARAPKPPAAAKPTGHKGKDD